MWKITRKDSQENVYVNGFTKDNIAVFEKVCYTDKAEVANHFLNKSGYDVKEVQMIPVEK